MRKAKILKMLLDLNDRVTMLECKQQILVEAVKDISEYIRRTKK